MVGLLLMGYLGLGYRAMAAHIGARPELMKRPGLKKPPSKATLHRAPQALGRGWLEDLNSGVLARFKGGDLEGHPSGTWPSIAPAWRSPAGATTTSGG